MLRLLGFTDEIVQEVLTGVPTAKVINMRLISWSAAGDVVQAFRNRPVVSNLCETAAWMARAWTTAETARTGPTARGVRSLKQARDTQSAESKEAVNSDIEGSCRPGEEGIWHTTDSWTRRSCCGAPRKAIGG